MDSIIQGDVDLETALDKMPATARDFMVCGARHAAIAGGFRSGKSVAACCFEILLGHEIPNSTHLVSRLNYPALKSTTMKTFLSLCPREWVADDGKGWKETEGRLVMNNGAEYLFRHLDITDAAIEGWIRSLNLTSFFVDQSEEIAEGTYLTLVGRLSQPTSPRHFGRLVLNPAGQDWNWRHFFDPKRPETWKEKRGFVITTDENAANLPPDYIPDLANTYPEEWQARFRRGEFADFSDLIFKDWSHAVHVYDANKGWDVFKGSNVPPSDWQVIVGIDIGGVDPWAFVFMAIEPETGNLYQFDEIYAPGILIKTLSERYYPILGDRELYGLAYDYENQQAALEMQEYGIAGTPAIKDVLAGIMKVGQYLHPDPRYVHPFTGKPGTPRYFVASNCENTIREIATWKWGKDRRGILTGKPAEGNDHCPDAVRYAIHTFRPEPRELPPPLRSHNPNLDVLSAMYWRDVEKEEERQELLRRRPHYNNWHRML